MSLFFSVDCFGQNSLSINVATEDKGKAIRLNVDSGIIDNSSECFIEIKAATKKKKLNKSQTLINFSSSLGHKEIYLEDLKKIRLGKSKRKNKTIFFKALANCNDTITESNSARVQIKRNKRNKSLRTRKWLAQLQEKFTNKPYYVEEAFPNLSFSQPVHIVSPLDSSGRFFVVQQRGKVLVFESNNEVNASSTFIDLSDKIKSTREEGLLSIAFHPDYSTNGFFYLYYSQVETGDSIISRFTVSESDPNAANIDSELVLLNIEQPSSIHQGSAMQFGQDGFLYLSLGDGGGAADPDGNGQNTSTLLGSLIRIDVDSTSDGKNYSIPSDNPFVGVNNAREEIYAYGFRNPWRFSIDSETNDIWLGDVGQNSFEEINLVEKGKNYGWKIKEAESCFSPSQNCNSEGLTDPIFSYGRTEGISVTGGYVYRGESIPSLNGEYLFADFNNGNIWSLIRENEVVEVRKQFSTEHLISSFGEDENKELYYLDYIAGKVYTFTVVTR